MASVAAHGLVLGLPWPSLEPTQSSQPAESATHSTASEPEVNVAFLPPSQLEAPPSPAASPDREPPTARSPQADRSSSLPVPPSTIPLPPVPSIPEAVATSPPPSPEQQPSPEPNSVQEPSLPDDPVSELPVDDGTSDLSEPTSPPLTLEEQLSEPTAYEYDGRKSLDAGEAALKPLEWVVAGQTYPEKLDPIMLPYQLGDHCLDTPPLLGLLMVVLDTDGNFVRGPEVISSTGYAVLDRQAIATVEAEEMSFPERSQAKAYAIEIAVQYPDPCL